MIHLVKAKIYLDRWILCELDSEKWFAFIEGIPFKIDLDGFIRLGKVRARIYNFDYEGRPEVT